MLLNDFVGSSTTQARPKQHVSVCFGPYCACQIKSIIKMYNLLTTEFSTELVTIQLVVTKPLVWIVLSNLSKNL